MRFSLFIILLISCQLKKPSQIDQALQNNDTALARKLAQKKLDRLRATVTDSSFAVILDASLQIQSLEFTLQKADSSQISDKYSEALIINIPDGLRLYDLIMKSYKLALLHTTRNTDIDYFTKELSLSQPKWLEKRFANKKTYEALISLFLLQKDIALISAIVYNLDNDLYRQELEKQYQALINNMEKGN